MTDLDPASPQDWEQQTYHLIVATIHKRLADPDLSTDDLVKLAKAFAENRRANNTATPNTPQKPTTPEPWTEKQEAEYQQNINDAVRRIYGLDLSNTSQDPQPANPPANDPQPSRANQPLPTTTNPRHTRNRDEPLINPASPDTRPTTNTPTFHASERPSTATAAPPVPPSTEQTSNNAKQQTERPAFRFAPRRWDPPRIRHD